MDFGSVVIPSHVSRVRVFMCFPRTFHNFPLGINPNVLCFVLTCWLEHKCCWYCCSSRYFSSHVDNFSINLRHLFLKNLYNRWQRSRKCELVYLWQRLCVCVCEVHVHTNALTFFHGIRPQFARFLFVWCAIWYVNFSVNKNKSKVLKILNV